MPVGWLQLPHFTALTTEYQEFCIRFCITGPRQHHCLSCRLQLGRSFSFKNKNIFHGPRLISFFRVPYKEGLYYWYQELLTGKSQTKSILTPSSTLEVNFDMEQGSLVADGADWVFVYVKGGKDEVTLSLSGPGTIIGDGEDIEANPVEVDERTKIATFLVQTTTTPGKIVATAKSGGGTASASVTSPWWTRYTI